MNPDFKKGNGLLPTVVTDANTKEVLMVAWMNEESFKRQRKQRKLGSGVVLVKSYGIKVVRAVMCNAWCAWR